MNNTTVSSAQFAIFPYLNKAFIRLNILTPRVIGADDAEFTIYLECVSNYMGNEFHCIYDLSEKIGLDAQL